MALMREVEKPFAIYQRAVRKAAQTLTDSPENDAAQARGNAALLVIEQAVRHWVAAHPTEDQPAAEAVNPHTPRLCACGHSNRAHTVPAPHSCFAFGQTCPCPAYRQLPHDEAVAQLDRNRRAATEREAARIAEEMDAVAEGAPS
jgi:hypothetical protein